MADDPQDTTVSRGDADATMTPSRRAAYDDAVRAQEADLLVLRSYVLPVLDGLELPLSAPPP